MLTSLFVNAFYRGEVRIMNKNRLICLVITLLAISFATTVNLNADDKPDKGKGVGPYAEHWKPIPTHRYWAPGYFYTPPENPQGE